MPFIVLMCRNVTTLVGCFALFAALTIYPAGQVLFEITKPDTDGFGIHKFIFFYCICFALGAAATLIRPARLSGFMQELAWLVPLVILVGTRAIIGVFGTDAILIEALASVFIIRNVYYGNGSILWRAASHKASVFLGDVSYSLYMLSTVCIHAGATLLFFLVPVTILEEQGFFANLSVAIVATAFILPLSWLQYTWIERPAINFGKRISGRIESDLSPVVTQAVD